MEKYTGSYWKFIFKDSKHWIALAAILIIFLWATISTGINFGTIFYALVFLVVILMSIRAYKERLKGKSS
nr:hypothetical protein [uncultured Flavobacterium sp.]